MYYYKTKTWFAPMNTVARFAIHENRLIKVYFNNGTWEIIPDTLELLDEYGKHVNSYDNCYSNDTEIIQNRFEAIIADFIQVNKPSRID